MVASYITNIIALEGTKNPITDYPFLNRIGKVIVYI